MLDVDRSATIAPIKNFICGTLLDGQQIRDDEDLLLSGLVDSLGVMSLVAHIEGEFGISIPFEEVLIENFETLEAIADYVNSRKLQDA